MMMTRLLVAYDSSEEANAALDVAIALAHDQRSSIVACYAVDIATEIGRVAAAFHYTPASAGKMLREDGKAILAAAVARAQAAGVTIETKLLDAPVISGITEYARRARADTIVVGSHGRSGLPRFLLGSVAEGLMRHAEVPVLVVRSPSRRPKVRSSARKSPAPGRRRPRS